MGRYKKFSPIGGQNFNLDTAEKMLMDEYENTYELPEDVNFIMPETPFVDKFIVDKIHSIYSKMQDKDDGGLECDWWTAVIGPESSGKSTFTAGFALEYCKIANKNFVDEMRKNVAFDELDIIRMISKINLDTKYDFIWADEGANVFFNRDSSTVARRWSMKFANSMRFLRYFVVVCSVELKQLDTIIKDHRIKTLIRIQEPGIYQYFNHNQLLALLSKNRGNRDAYFNWRAVEPEWVGRFEFSPETKKIVDMLKQNYLKRFQIEAKQEYTCIVKKKLFKMENTKNKSGKWKWEN